jgi:flagellin
VISSLNDQLQSSGITASIGSNGELQFAGTTAFTLDSVGAASAGNATATATSTIATNTANYNIDGGTPAVLTGTEALTFQNAGGSYNVTLNSVTGASSASAIQQLNTQLAGSGITAVLGTTGEVNIQSANAFSVNQTAAATTGVGLFAGTGAEAVTAPVAGASSTGNALAALNSLATAVKNLGLVQGAVGSGENVLADAIGLANSQITNRSAAESRIRDADIAAQAANLTKTQTLEQSSVAALAQANAAPQALLKLLQ